MLVRRIWPARPTFDSPFSDFGSVRREVQRLLESVAGDSWNDVGAGVFPPINVTQDHDNFYLRAELPGVRANDLSISAVRNRVLISGRREIQTENERVSYHRKERAEGSFNRSVTLPHEIDADRVEARYVDGILTLALPKSEAAKPRQITVNA